MRKIQLDDALRARLSGFEQQTTPICDDKDEVIGYFVPLKHYKEMFNAAFKPPFSEEEMQRRLKETGGCSLEEIWKRLEQQYGVTIPRPSREG